MSVEILTVTFEGREICTFDRVRPHGAGWPTARVQTGRPVLAFTDSQGRERAFDLSFVRDEGKDWVHFCVRVSPEYLVQPDLVLGDSSEDPERAFRAGEVPGVRLQPFVLPESSKNYELFEGRGLFSRGFHFKGIVTPGNVSLICVCGYCDQSFRIQSFHAGMSDVVYFYCSDCSETLVVSADLADAPGLLETPDAASLERFEQRLPTCAECGGSFAYYNPMRCPHCKEPYIDFSRFPEERIYEYYGNTLYGRRPQEFNGHE
jgi:hypothetical protein